MPGQEADQSPARQAAPFDLRLITDAVPSLVAYVDSGGLYRFVNHAYREWFGHEPAQLYGRHVREVIGEAAFGRIRAHFDAALSGRRASFEAEVPYKDGGTRFIHAEYVPDLGPDGQARGYLALIQDITEFRRNERKLAASEEVLHLAMRAGRMGAWSRDLRGGAVWWSRELEEIFGLPAGGFDGTYETYMGFVHEDDQALLAGAVARAIAGREDYSVEFRFRHASGEWRWMDGRGRAEYAPDGTPVTLYGLGIDITERMRNEARRRESEQQLRQATEAAQLITWDMDLASGRVRCDARAREIWGIVEGTAEEFFALAHPDDRGLLRRKGAEAIADGRYSVQYRVIGPDGIERWLHSRGEVLYDRDRKPVRFTGVTADISESKRVEEALRASEQRLIEADRRKNHFLATLAHELRNPLAPIRNAAQIVQLKAPGDRDLGSATAVIERQLRHMVRLIDDLLDVSRITNGKIELRPEEVWLRDVLDQAIETSRPHLDGHDVVLSHPARPIRLRADPVRLAQVFSNLLNNAFKFTPPGGRVAVSATLEDGQAVVRVRDDGIGIAAPDMARIFEMFSQVGGGTEHSRGGLGIGLALARGLMELHGGAIEARSEGIGHGSEFEVRLPAVVDADAAPREASPAASRAPTSRRFLVVDDNADNASSLATLLRMAGHRVETAHDGWTALATADAFRPDVALVDIGMPGMDGHETCRAFRETPWGKSVLVIALTGWGQEEDQRRSREAGFDAHLMKPVDPAALMSVVESALSSREKPAFSGK